MAWGHRIWKESNLESASKEAAADPLKEEMQVGKASEPFPHKTDSKEDPARTEKAGLGQGWSLLAVKTARRPLSMEGNKLS
jgi:hypothetical protein